jgi:hypothetical protein
MFFVAVTHVMWPLRRLNRGVVRTTSPVAPSFIINTFIVPDERRSAMVFTRPSGQRPDDQSF